MEDQAPEIVVGVDNGGWIRWKKNDHLKRNATVGVDDNPACYKPGLYSLYPHCTVLRPSKVNASSPTTNSARITKIYVTTLKPEHVGAYKISYEYEYLLGGDPSSLPPLLHRVAQIRAIDLPMDRAEFAHG